MHRVNWPLRKILWAECQRLIRRYIWRMQIHPSARIEPTAYVDRTWPKGVHIEANCYVGEHAVFLTHDMVRGLYLDTVLGAGSVLGARCIVMPGLVIGEGCVIAPGAVVIKDMPARTHAIGNPAAITPL